MFLSIIIKYRQNYNIFIFLISKYYYYVNDIIDTYV